MIKINASNEALTVEDNRKLFSIGKRMLDIPAIFQTSDEKSFFCYETHIFDCEILHEGKNINISTFFNENIGTQLKIFRTF
jgi:hypothetical protein